ncbi:CitMHS family transporter [Paraburkholderia silvatlantica]|uniref:CitMHS family citrate-Mg2+:H+ or citrate-Ca2+:H+ symporter n=1 Tax=Paraburkholderia silvatlantica TaxID=321895 RepID=A0ABR6FY44_9BURK|nr:citrate:proton symporter [Paraburkholderia silvatlantica]MBB2931484.1 CitMHS family citrate-Mg2+:H+ or citrate-Ca2+:H+ symporter [Paraburkholderia silvatlantica]PVY27852.1 CitMHS family citrate-Mg2+:H+ or citrate-Ca2+:H+ symporter [Paraburkholderia silvatlantica]PXW34699.1 CitMHS family citrate-Mg2+:H+ or citrate-Ca2+:H+ symporter [Paraburkholderia silvatlantica]
MLPLLGLVTIVVLLAAILSKRMSPLVALIIVPIVASLIGGFGLQTSQFVIDGLKSLAPVVGMFVFAILYFGTITDAGTLDPIIDRILRTVGTKPTRIVVGTTLLALLIHLDGSGAVCFLVTIPAMLPLYERLNMDKRVLAAAVSMAAGINFLPWTGPMIRASASLHLPVSALFNPLIPVQAIGLVFVFSMAWWLGWREEKRLGYASASGSVPLPKRELTPEEQALRRPQNFWFNIVLTVVVLGTMVVMGEKIPPAIMFMVGLCIALMVNYPNVDMQRKRIDAHARAALMMAGILLAAGVFTGIMQGSGMLKAMAQAAVGVVPPAFAGRIPVALGVLSMPLSMLFDPDSFYFGVLPVIAEVASQLGVPAVHIGQAALLGQMTTGFPVSPLTPATFLVVGLCGIDLADHQKFTFPLLFGASIVMTIACVVLGVFAL